MNEIKEPAPYDMSIHSNPDPQAWAKFFCETFPDCVLDEGTMIGWFANSMMAAHDCTVTNSQIGVDSAYANLRAKMGRVKAVMQRQTNGDPKKRFMGLFPVGPSVKDLAQKPLLNYDDSLDVIR